MALVSYDQNCSTVPGKILLQVFALNWGVCHIKRCLCSRHTDRNAEDEKDVDYSNAHIHVCCSALSK